MSCACLTMPAFLELIQQTPVGVSTYRMPAVKSNRPVNLSMGQVLAVNLRSPVAIASILHRLSGVIVFLLVPVLLWILDKSLSSPEGFDYVKMSFWKYPRTFCCVGICSRLDFPLHCWG